MLSASIYTNPLYKGCSNNGISERYNKVTIVNADGPSQPSGEAPPVILKLRDLGSRKIFTFYPASFVDNEWIQTPGKWWMAGGSFIHTADARFNELCKRLGMDFYGAISFHDREE